MLVLGDGPEVYVFSGVSDAPMWKQFCDGILVGVGALRDRVITLDSEGRLCTWRAVDGVKEDEVHIECRAPRQLRHSPDGICLIVDRDEVIIADFRGGKRSVKFAGVSAAAFGGAQPAFGAGTRNGRFEAFGADGKPTGASELGAPVVGVAWRPQGQWAVAAGNVVSLVSADGATVAAKLDAGGPITSVAVSAEGALIAAAVGNDVFIFEPLQGRRLGVVRVTRPVRGIAFGQASWLALGFEDAEATRVDLMTGQMCKTEAHPGRVASRWGIRVECDPMSVRSAVTQVRAGGQPIARQIEAEEGGRSCLWYLGILFVMFIICTGCTGLLSGGYWYYAYMR